MKKTSLIEVDMRKLGIFSFGLLMAQVAGAQVITTLAGTSWIFPSTSLSAQSAPLGAISGVAIDNQGNTYLADPSNYLILKVGSGGMLSIAAGNGQQGHSGDNGPAVNASINPTDVAVDANGNIYIQDQSYIRMVTPDGKITTVAGTGKFGAGPDGPALSVNLSAASGMAVDKSGSLYFADTFNHCVRKLTSGTISTIAGKCGASGFAGDGSNATAALLNQPSGLAFDSFGNLYIADTNNRRVREVALSAGASPVITSVFGPSSLSTPVGLAIDSKSNLYIADSGANQVLQLYLGAATKTATPFGGTGAAAGAFAGDGGSALQARLNGPLGMVVDPAGNLYLADAGNYRLRVISAGTQKISTLAGSGAFRFGGDGGQAINAALNMPAGMAFDSKGNLYVADSANHRVRMVTPGGIITSVAGNGIPGFSGDTGSATAASLNDPTDVALDPAGKFLYIADSGNARVRQVALATGAITTVAGGGSSSNDGAATSLNLLAPEAVAVDASGNLYVADTNCNKVYLIAGGQAKTFAGQPGTCVNGYSDNQAAVGGTMTSPEGLAFDGAGNLYIADTGNNVIRMVSTGGKITTVAGQRGATTSTDGPATSSGIVQPFAVAVDGSGNVYIAEFDGRIREVSNGMLTTIAGGGPATVLGDGGTPTRAGLNQPEGIAVDGSGNVVIGDTGNGRVRKVIGNVSPTPPAGPPPPPPAWQISTQTLTFTQASAGADLPPQTLTLAPVANTVNGVTTPAVNGLPFTATTSCTWLTLSANSGSMPTSITATASAASLAPGQYACTITFTAQNTAAPTVVVNASLTVAKPPDPVVVPPAIGSDAQGGITFTAPLNSTPLTSQFHISNTGGGTLSFTTTVTCSGSAGWLNISPASGSATPGNPVTVTATATPGSMTPGIYSCSIVTAGAGSTLSIPVTLTISGPTAVMLVSESAMTFTAASGGGSPLPHNFGILNTGACPNNVSVCPMDWQASATSFVNGALTTSDWLSLSPASGSVQQPFLDVSLVNVSVNPARLQPGTYYGRITITSKAAINSPSLITVTVNVLPAGFSLPPEIFPTGLIFTGIAGVNPGSQDLTVGNSTNTTTSYQSQAIGRGFTFLPLNATQTNTQPTKVHVYPDFSSLSPSSTLHGGITFLFADGTLQTASVLTVVAPPGVIPNSLSPAEARARSVDPRASGCTPQSTQVVIRSLQTGFSAVVGHGLNVEAQVTDSCGNMVTAQTAGANVFAFVNTAKVAMTHIGNGVWQGTWTPSATGPIALEVDALIVTNGLSVGGRSGTLTGTATPVAVNTGSSPSAAPLTSLVQQAASFDNGLPIAPGELITVWGQNLASSAALSSTLPLPTAVNGLQVQLGITALPILYTDNLQMNVQVPYTVPVGTTYQLSVVNGTSLSVPQTVTVAPAVPGIFTTNSQGTGQGSIYHPNSTVLADSNNPASIGEIVTIFCTGLGRLQNPDGDATINKEGQGPDGAARAENTVTATVGGVDAPVDYAGVTPTYPGLYQVNIHIPAGIKTGNAVPVQLTAAGITSQTVTVAVH